MKIKVNHQIVAFLTLFTSTGTLLCCALPAALSVIAGTAAVGSLVSVFPWLIPLSQNKGWIFLGAGGLIFVSAVLTFRPKGKVACALSGGKGCEQANKFSKVILGCSIVIYGIGLFMAYAIVPIIKFFGG